MLTGRKSQNNKSIESMIKFNNKSKSLKKDH